MPRILVVDNYDSFTYNLAQYVEQCGGETLVVRNDKITLQEIKSNKPDGILLSPGPSGPEGSAVCIDVVAAALADELTGIPVFGVCLGLQTIGHVAGAKVSAASKVRHGKQSWITTDQSGVFSGCPEKFEVVRYHSLVIEPGTLPSSFVVSATSDDDGEIMAARHKELPIEGVQFHPESVLSQHGMEIIGAYVRSAGSRS